MFEHPHQVYPKNLMFKKRSHLHVHYRYNERNIQGVFIRKLARAEFYPQPYGSEQGSITDSIINNHQ